MILNIDTIKNEAIATIKKYSARNVEVFNNKKGNIKPHYSIIFFPSNSTMKKLDRTMHFFKTKYPNHFYMPPDKLHITIISKVPITIPLEKIVKFTEKNLSKKLEFRVHGMVLSQYSAAFLAFPQNIDLGQIRTKFRNEISNKISKHWSSYEKMGWMNFLRFKEKPPQEFYEDILKNVDADFGIVKGRIEIVKNSSKTLNNAETVYKLKK